MARLTASRILSQCYTGWCINSGMCAQLFGFGFALVYQSKQDYRDEE